MLFLTTLNIESKNVSFYKTVTTCTFTSIKACCSISFCLISGKLTKIFMCPIIVKLFESKALALKSLCLSVLSKFVLIIDSIVNYYASTNQPRPFINYYTSWTILACSTTLQVIIMKPTGNSWACDSAATKKQPEKAIPKKTPLVIPVLFGSDAHRYIPSKERMSICSETRTLRKSKEMLVLVTQFCI